MIIKAYPLGPLGSNLYVIEKNNRFIIIDPSVSPERLNMLDILDKVEAIFVTHGHFDHIMAIDEWTSCGTPVYMHAADFDALKDPDVSLVSDFGYDVTFVASAMDISDCENKVLLGDNGVRVNIIHTPGHAPGQVCIVITDLETGEKAMFSGDMLFAGAIGRFDFNRSNANDMRKSVELLKNLDLDCDVYPGHGPSTTLDIEKRSNPYFY